MTISQWLLSTLCTTAVLGGFVYFLRDIILAKLAARIKHQYDEDLTRLRSNLAQGEFRYSLVFKETADKILKTYQMLLEVYEAAQDVTTDWGDEERRKELGLELDRKALEFGAFYPPNEIYILKKTRHKISNFWKTLNSMVRRHGMLRQAGKGQVVNPATVEKMAKEGDELREEAAKLLASLEDEFQLILGFPLDDDKSESK